MTGATVVGLVALVVLVALLLIGGLLIRRRAFLRITFEIERTNDPRRQKDEPDDLST